VLFSIEVTATHYLVSNYLKAFFCAVCAALYFRMMTSLQAKEQYDTALFNTAFTPEHWDIAELFFFMLLGAICGLVGAAFVRLNAMIMLWQRTNPNHWLMRVRYTLPIVVIFITATLTFPEVIGDFMALSNRKVVNDMFGTLPLSACEVMTPNGTDTTQCKNLNAKDWDSVNIFWSLVALGTVKFFLTVVSVTLPIPCGLFTPVFCAGAALGRLYGESLHAMFPTGIGSQVLVPGGYAVVGAAALCGGVTRAISSAVFVFELTGQLNHIMPVMTATIIAVTIGNLFTPSIYDSIMEISKIPYYYSSKIANQDAGFDRKALHIMTTDPDLLTPDTTWAQLQSLAERSTLYEIPIVDNLADMFLVGSIKCDDIRLLIEEREKKGYPIDTTEVDLMGDDFVELVRAPTTVLDNLPVYKLTLQFIMLHLKEAFVISQGRLEGVITKKQLMQAEWEHEEIKAHVGFPSLRCANSAAMAGADANRNGGNAFS